MVTRSIPLRRVVRRKPPVKAGVRARLCSAGACPPRSDDTRGGQAPALRSEQSGFLSPGAPDSLTIRRSRSGRSRQTLPVEPSIPRLLFLLLGGLLAVLGTFAGQARAAGVPTAGDLNAGWQVASSEVSSQGKTGAARAVTPLKDGVVALDAEFLAASEKGQTAPVAEFWRPLTSGRPGEAGWDLRNQRLSVTLEVPPPPALPIPHHDLNAAVMMLETVVRLRNGDQKTTDVRMSFRGPRGGGTIVLSMPLTPTTWQRHTAWAPEDRQVHIEGEPIPPTEVIALGLRIHVPEALTPWDATFRLLKVELVPVVNATPVPDASFLSLSGTNALWGHPDPALDKLGYWVGSTTEASLGYAQHRPYLRRLFSDLRKSGFRIARVPLFHDLGGDSVVRDSAGIITGFSDPSKVHTDLQALLDEASGADLKLVPVLVSFEVADGEGADSPQDFTDPRAREAFLSHVVMPIAEQLAEPKNLPVIAAFDLMNEPDGLLAVNLPVRAFQETLKEASRRIQALPGRPLRTTVGFQKLSNVIKFGTGLNIDVMQVHSYQDGRFTDLLTDNLGEFGLGESLGIPVVMWEVGTSHTEPALTRVVQTLHHSGFSGVALYGDDKRFVIPPYAASALTGLSGSSAVDLGQDARTRALAWPDTVAPTSALPPGFSRVPGLQVASTPPGDVPVCVPLFEAELGTPRYGKPFLGQADGTCGEPPPGADSTLQFSGRLRDDGIAEVDFAKEFFWILHERVIRTAVTVRDDAGGEQRVTFPDIQVTAVRTFERSADGRFHSIHWRESVELRPDARLAPVIETLRALAGESPRTLDALYLAAQRFQSHPQHTTAGGDDALAPEFAELVQIVVALTPESSSSPSAARGPFSRGPFVTSWVHQVAREAGSLEVLGRFTAAGQRLVGVLRRVLGGEIPLSDHPAAVGQVVTWSWQFARSPLHAELMQALDQLSASPVIQAQFELLLSEPLAPQKLEVEQPPVALEQAVKEIAHFLWGSAESLARGTQTLEDIERPIRVAIDLLRAQRPDAHLHGEAGLQKKPTLSTMVLSAMGALLLLTALLGTLRRRHPGARKVNTSAGLSPHSAGSTTTLNGEYTS